MTTPSRSTTNGAVEALVIRLMANRIASTVALLQSEVQVTVQAPLIVEANRLVRQTARLDIHAPQIAVRSKRRIIGVKLVD